jgi:hypothetical protein
LLRIYSCKYGGVDEIFFSISLAQETSKKLVAVEIMINAK